MKQLKYVYGITTVKTKVRFENVRTIEKEGLVALVEDVPEDEFGEEALLKNMQNTDWMTKRVMLHHQVLEAYHKDHPLIPFSFGTVFSSDDAISQLLSNTKDKFKGTLHKIEGKQEWGIKLFYNNAHLELYLKNHTDPLKEWSKTMKSATAGQRFMLKKEYDELLKKEKKDWLNSKRKALYQALESTNGAVICSLETTPKEMAQNNDPNILNIAVLLYKDITLQQLQQKINLVIAQNSAHLYAQISGPWSPYNFVNQ